MANEPSNTIVHLGKRVWIITLLSTLLAVWGGIILSTVLPSHWLARLVPFGQVSEQQLSSDLKAIQQEVSVLHHQLAEQQQAMTALQTQIDSSETAMNNLTRNSMELIVNKLDAAEADRRSLAESIRNQSLSSSINDPNNTTSHEYKPKIRDKAILGGF